MTCTTKPARPARKGAKKRKPVKKCTTKTLAGSATFTTAATAKATLSRGGRTVARGTASRRGGLMLRAARALPRGRYTLTLRYREAGRRIVATAPLTLR